MKILITGGLGYIGSSCFLYLYKNHDIVIVDNFSNASLDNLQIFKTLKINVKFYHIDITNIEQLRKIFDQHHFDIVIHLASYKSVTESMENPLLYYHNNVSGTIQILRVMKEFNC
jgi:UDP-glucose 4-epimerase